MRELGYEQAPCLLANDDEAYSYNSKINRLSTLQETRMLQEAVNTLLVGYVCERNAVQVNKSRQVGYP